MNILKNKGLVLAYSGLLQLVPDLPNFLEKVKAIRARQKLKTLKIVKVRMTSKARKKMKADKTRKK